MSAKRIDIECTGYAIAADWYDGSPENILIVMAGYSSARKDLRGFVQPLQEKLGWTVVAIDPSGHGESPFELRDTRPAQHVLELVCVFDWLRQQHPDAHISILGASYSAFLATQLTKYRNFDKLVLKTPAIYKPETFYDPWSLRIDNKDEYDKIMRAYREDEAQLIRHPVFGRASNFTGKTLVVIHGEDEVIPTQTINAFIKTFEAETFEEPGFIHSTKDIINDGKISKERLDSHIQKIADWLVS